MNQNEIKKILKEHGEWLRDPTRGKKADFGNKDLRYATFTCAILEKANFEGANLSYADLRFANLKNANLKNVNFCHSYLLNANLLGANLEGANLEGVKSNKCTIWCQADLDNIIKNSVKLET